MVPVLLLSQMVARGEAPTGEIVVVDRSLPFAVVATGVLATTFCSCFKLELLLLLLLFELLLLLLLLWF